MKTAIAIAAHPDDIELFMAGTLMRLAAAGYEAHYFANGCCEKMRCHLATDNDAIPPEFEKIIRLKLAD